MKFCKETFSIYGLHKTVKLLNRFRKIGKIGQNRIPENI